MIVEFKPLKLRPPHWKDAEAARPSTPFSAKYGETTELLQRELRAVNATSAFLQVEGPSTMVRNDGQLRADAKPTHPGVILTIETRKLGTLIYETDRFSGWGSQAGWHANLRAIALGMEALRKVDRYGIASQGQQYAGYRELGSGTPMPAAKMTLDQAQRLLAEHGGFRAAAKEHHPDAGGDPDLFRRIVEANDIVKGLGS